ncbi:MAG: hypothetical protein JJE23_13965, partial [Thermoleophilia bacterium]|nr:hypothetical protein [Thermoleophilia bacterium]
MSGVAGQASDLLGSERAADRGRLLTAAGLAVFIIVSLAAVAAKGVFLSRDVIFLWVLLGLLAVSLSDINGYLRGVLTDW